MPRGAVAPGGGGPASVSAPGPGFCLLRRGGRAGHHGGHVVAVHRQLLAVIGEVPDHRVTVGLAEALDEDEAGQRLLALRVGREEFHRGIESGGAQCRGALRVAGAAHGDRAMAGDVRGAGVDGEVVDRDGRRVRVQHRHRETDEGAGLAVVHRGVERAAQCGGIDAREPRLEQHVAGQELRHHAGRQRGQGQLVVFDAHRQRHAAVLVGEIEAEAHMAERSRQRSGGEAQAVLRCLHGERCGTRGEGCDQRVQVRAQRRVIRGQRGGARRGGGRRLGGQGQPAQRAHGGAHRGEGKMGEAQRAAVARDLVDAVFLPTAEVVVSPRRVLVSTSVPVPSASGV